MAINNNPQPQPIIGVDIIDLLKTDKSGRNYNGKTPPNFNGYVPQNESPIHAQSINNIINSTVSQDVYVGRTWMFDGRINYAPSTFQTAFKSQYSNPDYYNPNNPYPGNNPPK